MGGRYVQFLGTRPGIVVELIDDSGSPFVVRTENGFEFSISAEDFRHYYRPEASTTPSRWRPFVTEPQSGMVQTGKIAKLMEIIHSFEAEFQDFAKARAFLRDAVKIMGDDPEPNPQRLKEALEKEGWNQQAHAAKVLQRVRDIPLDARPLLLSDTCAVIPLVPGLDGEEVHSEKKKEPLRKKSAGIEKARPEKPTPRARQARMKNAEMSVDGDILTITVDLSREFGPSKSGKTIIVASSEGNKTVPGRVEKVGLNIYKQPDKRAAKGRRKSFKNVEMDVKGDTLRVTVDLSKEFGPSKSGKTIIIATTEGNQLVFGREEKIGLNVYRKIE